MADPIEQVIKLLQKELQWHQELARVLDNKLDAMRHYDLSRLEALSLAEQNLLDNISANEQNRNNVIRIATSQYYPEKTGRLATARELAQAVKGPLREKLNGLAALLLDITQKVRSLNHINALATEKIIGHVDQVFKIIANSGHDIGLYGRLGKKNMFEQNRIVDAIA